MFVFSAIKAKTLAPVILSRFISETGELISFIISLINVTLNIVFLCLYGLYVRYKSY